MLWEVEILYTLRCRRHYDYWMLCAHCTLFAPYAWSLWCCLFFLTLSLSHSRSLHNRIISISHIIISGMMKNMQKNGTLSLYKLHLRLKWQTLRFDLITNLRMDPHLSVERFCTQHICDYIQSGPKQFSRNNFSHKLFKLWIIECILCKVLQSPA